MLHEVGVLHVAERLYRIHAGLCSRGGERQFDSARRQEGCHPVITGLAVDVAAIVCIDVEGHERFARAGGPPFEKFVEQPFPRCGMHARGLGQYAVEIEQDGVVITRGECDNGTDAGHDPFLGAEALTALVGFCRLWPDAISNGEFPACLTYPLLMECLSTRSARMTNPPVPVTASPVTVSPMVFFAGSGSPPVKPSSKILAATNHHERDQRSCRPRRERATSRSPRPVQAGAR